MGKATVFYPSPAGAAVPQGGIILWSGAVAAIPDGWALCDGTKGTPDLRGRFVVGAGSAYTVGATGGEASHALTVDEMPRHSHGISLYQNKPGEYATTNAYPGPNQANGMTAYAGWGSPHENRPPYYALCYIMKL